MIFSYFEKNLSKNTKKTIKNESVGLKKHIFPEYSPFPATETADIKKVLKCNDGTLLKKINR
jgi:hypothetical protein